MSGCRVPIASVVAVILSMAGVAASQTAADAKRAGVISSKATLPFEDRFAIHELFARYSQALDMGLGEELVANVFAPDGILEPRDPREAVRLSHLSDAHSLRQRRLGGDLVDPADHDRLLLFGREAGGAQPVGEIGRASCRERVFVGV